jgi:hypothetical protein
MISPLRTVDILKKQKTQHLRPASKGRWVKAMLVRPHHGMPSKEHGVYHRIYADDRTAAKI